MNRKAALQATKDLSKAVGFMLMVFCIGIFIAFGLINYPWQTVPIGVVIIFSLIWWAFYNDAKRHA